MSDDARTAYVVPAGKDMTVSLGTLESGSVLRLGILPLCSSDAVVEGRVYVGNRLVNTVRVPDGQRWRDYRIEMSGYGQPGEPCRVVLDSPFPFQLAPCELVSTLATRPNVLVFLVDTLRPDHLGSYGYHRNTSPNLDAFARDAVRFTHMVSQSSWTRPAVASLFTGAYPSVHGARDRADVIHGDIPTLAEALRDAGYEGHGYVSNPNVLPVWGFSRGFSRYVNATAKAGKHANDGLVVDAAIAGLRNVMGRPWYLYVHTVGPHAPYEPPAPYERRFVTSSELGGKEEIERRRTIDLYDGEIAFTDAQFGRLVDELKRQGTYNNSLIIV
ncbi:MAG: sulfatase, partial [Candidatus Hydrogenedentes bacterium]|nr:sulfatase [Candidatus Hydrogenedentota bacterium]